MNFERWVRMRMGLLTHPQFYRSPLGAIYRRALWKLAWSRRARIRFRTQFGFEVEGSPADIGMASLFYRGQYEWAELQLWQRFIDRPGLTIIDVGANLGIYCLLAAAVARRRGHDDAQIVGFEPNPGECAKLRRNVEINGFRTVRVEQVALSDHKGSCRLAVPPDGLGVFGHLLDDGEVRDPRDEEVEVTTVDLDGWCLDHGVARIDLMKLDVEGHELRVLEGAASLLARSAIGVLLMEIGHGEWRRCVDLILAHGYSVHAIGSRGAIEEFDPARIGGWCNVLALAPDAGGAPR